MLPYGRAGIDFDFRLCDALSIGIEANATRLSDKYNSKNANSVDWYFNVLAGFRINLGKTYRKKETPAPIIIEPEPEPIVEPEPVPEPEPIVEPEPIEPLTQNVFFTIGKSNVRDSERDKITAVAEYLEQNPDAKVAVTGYADKGTGTAAINARLAERRAATVADILREEYHISPDRITVDSKGDTVQPFEENDLNRVTICIAQ